MNDCQMMEAWPGAEKPGINLSWIVHMTDADTVGILSTFTLKLFLRY
jgi:hypothetical protein